jgi:hypothetical protein
MKNHWVIDSDDDDDSSEDDKIGDSFAERDAYFINMLQVCFIDNTSPVVLTQYRDKINDSLTIQKIER